MICPFCKNELMERSDHVECTFCNEVFNVELVNVGFLTDPDERGNQGYVFRLENDRYPVRSA